MPEHYIRRSVLAAAAATPIVGTAGATEDEDEDEEDSTTVTQSQEVTVSQSQEVRVIRQEKVGHQTVEDGQCFSCTEEPKQATRIGTFYAKNRSDCQRRLTFEVSGRLAPEGEEMKHSSFTTYLGPGKECYVGFTGTVRKLECEDGDLEIRIEQLSEAQDSICS